MSHPTAHAAIRVPLDLGGAMRRTILAADIELRSITAAKIATMEAIIAPVRAAAIEDEEWTVVETAMFAMGFKRLDLERGDSPFEFRFTFELDGMTVMFDDPETKLRLNVCEHVHTEVEWDHLPDDPITREHLDEGYQIIRRETGESNVVMVIWDDCAMFSYDCGEVA